MNRKELLAVGVGLVLILGVAGVANVMESVSITERPYESHSEASDNGASEATNATVPVIQAMRTAQREAGGTAVEARLGQTEYTDEPGRPVQVYEVSVLNGSGSATVVDINAENGTVLGRHPAENQSDGWQSLFGNETSGEAPSRQLNLDAIRSGPEAIQLVREQSNVNRTVTQVQVGVRNGTVVYNVQMVTEAGGRSTVTVAAYPDQGGVLSNESTQTTTE